MSNDFISDYKKYVEPLSEIPVIFSTWCALSCLAAVAQRKIWLTRGHITIAPNLYVVLDADPGVGKDTAMDIVKGDLLGHEAISSRIPVKSDSITKEALYQQMANMAQNSTDSSGKIWLHSSLTLFASEMGLLIKKNDRDFVEALKSLYNSGPVFRYTTKGKGENILWRPYLNILAGTTPDWVARNVEEDLMEGGLCARTVFVFATLRDRGKLNPEPVIGPEQEDAKTRMIARMEEVLQLCGEVKFSPHATMIYHEWYMTHYTRIPSSPKMKHYHQRKRVHITKIAMLCSLARNNSLIVEDRDVAQAMQILEETEPGMSDALRNVGRNELNPIAESMLQEVIASGKLRVRDWLAQNFSKARQEELREITTFLKDQDMVTYEKDASEVLWVVAKKKEKL